MNYDVVLHVDSDEPKVLNLALNNAANYKNGLPGESFRMVLVANGPAVTLFTADHAELAARGAELAAMGLDIRLCANALKSHGIASDALWPDSHVVPAGVVEIVRLQREGFAYIKP